MRTFGCRVRMHDDQGLFFINGLPLHFTIFWESFIKKIIAPFILMNLYITTYCLQGWRFNDFVVYKMWLLDLKSFLDFRVTTRYIDLKHLNFNFVWIFFSKFCSRCSLLEPWCMIQNEIYKIKLLPMNINMQM